jgi:hypothetical protein
MSIKDEKGPEKVPSVPFFFFAKARLSSTCLLLLALVGSPPKRVSSSKLATLLTPGGV